MKQEGGLKPTASKEPRPIQNPLSDLGSGSCPVDPSDKTMASTNSLTTALQGFETEVPS